MSQNLPPETKGKCNQCHQRQPYTNQICYFCEARLPWAVPVVATVPPPVPVYPVRPLPQNSDDTGKTIAIVIGSIVGGLVVLSLLVVVVLSILGNRIQNKFVASQVDMMQNSAPVAAVAGECGAMNSEECQWYQQINSLFPSSTENAPKDETISERLIRQKIEYARFKSGLDNMRIVPPRCIYSMNLFRKGADEMILSNQMMRSGYFGGDLSTLQKGINLNKRAVETMISTAFAVRQLLETPNPNN